MSFLFGKQPKVTTQNLSTVSQPQSAVQQAFQNYIIGNQQPGAASSFQPQPGPYASNLSNLQTGSLQSLENALLTLPSQGTPQQAATTGAGMTALTNFLTQGPPQINIPQSFEQQVAAPLENTFQTQTLPSVLGALGGSARTGGTDYSNAVGIATEGLNAQLAGAYSQYGLSEDIANLNAASTYGGQTVAGAGEAGSVAAGAAAPASADIQNLIATLSAGGVPTAEQNLAIQNAIQSGQVSQQDLLTLLQIMGGFSTAPTMQASSTVNPGSSGILPYLIAGGAKVASAYAPTPT